MRAGSTVTIEKNAVDRTLTLDELKAFVVDLETAGAAGSQRIEGRAGPRGGIRQLKAVINRAERTPS